MSKDPHSLYLQLGQLIATAPVFDVEGRLNVETMTWLGRASALVARSGSDERMVFNMAADRVVTPSQLQSRWVAGEQLMGILYRCLGAAELASPAAAQGAFIPVGNAFDAMAAFAKAAAYATKDILIVDPYMDDKTLTDFVPTIPEKIKVRLLADASYVKPSLAPAAARWIAQHGVTRPLEARLAAVKTLHDRLLILDGSQAWVMTQSLNAIATRSPASIVRMEGDAASLKIAAFEAIWAAASPV